MYHCGWGWLVSISRFLSSFTMKTGTLPLLVLLLSCGSAVVYSQQPGSCSTCNCQLNTVDGLLSLIESVVNQSLVARLPTAINQVVDSRLQDAERRVNASIDEKIASANSQRDIPVVRLMYVSRSPSAVQLRNISARTGQHAGSSSDVIATISNFNPSTSSTASNLLAYRPNYRDFHTSGLAGMFVNVEGVFPCVAGSPEYHPVCKLFTYEDDGFRNGRAIIDASDIGNNFNVFSGSNRATFGFAFTGCPTFTTDCFSTHAQYSIVCLLPRDRCG